MILGELSELTGDGGDCQRGKTLCYYCDLSDLELERTELPNSVCHRSGIKVTMERRLKQPNPNNRKSGSHKDAAAPCTPADGRSADAEAAPHGDAADAEGTSTRKDKDKRNSTGSRRSSGSHARSRRASDEGDGDEPTADDSYGPSVARGGGGGGGSAPGRISGEGSVSVKAPSFGIVGPDGTIGFGAGRGKRLVVA